MRETRNYIVPESLERALELAQGDAGRAAYIAGGTALAAANDPGIETLVDITGLGLDRVLSTTQGLRLGATAKLERLLGEPSVAACAQGILAEALARTRTPAWRNQATLGGRLREANPHDLVTTCLLALDATIGVRRGPAGPEENLPLAAATGLGRGCLILHVDIAALPGWRFALETLALSALDVPLVGVAVGLRRRDEVVEAARVATCGLTAGPARAAGVETVLLGMTTREPQFGPALAALARDCQPEPDFRAGAAYRAHLGGVLLARALRRALAPPAATM